MYEDLLRECGLTKNESLVYLALLRIGKSKSGELVKEARISGGKIYETLYKLIQKGLVVSLIENKIKCFIANDPKTLLSYLEDKKNLLEEKEAKLKKLLPEFNLLKKHKDKLDNVVLIRGMKGIFSVVDKYLMEAKSIKIMGVTSFKKEMYNDFWRRWHIRRVKLKKRAEILIFDKNTEYGEFFSNLNYTKIREFKHFTPSSIMILDKSLFIFSYDEDFICVHLNSESISKSFLEFFEGLWSIAK